MARSLAFPYRLGVDCSIISCSLTNLSDLLALALLSLIELAKLWALHDHRLGFLHQGLAMLPEVLLSE
jgi:hypothetical protein